jgi:hypothetical protein
LIFNQKNRKIFFIHVPRTSGISTLRFLESNGFKQEVLHHPKNADVFLSCWGNHVEAKIIKEEYDLSQCEYIFSYFRNPLDRIISVYKFLNFSEYNNFDEFVEDMFFQYERNQYIHGNMIRPQTDFYVENCNIIKFNNNKNVSEILKSKKFEIYENFPHINESKNISIDVSDNIKKKIKKFYKEDYVLYNYLM